MGVNKKYGAGIRKWAWPQHKVQGGDGGRVTEDHECQDRGPDLDLNEEQQLK